MTKEEKKVHTQKCSELSNALRKKLKADGLEKDGGIASIFYQAIGANSAEDTLLTWTNIAFTVLEHYNNNKSFRKFLKMEASAESVSVRKGLESLSDFLEECFISSVPFIEMNRLEENPEFFTEEQLDFLHKTYVLNSK